MQIPSAESSANEIIRTIHAIAAANAPLGAQLGIVMSVNPLRISVNNIVLDEKQLYIDQFLLTGYQRETSGETSMTNIIGDVALGNVTGDISLGNVTGQLSVSGSVSEG